MRPRNILVVLLLVAALAWTARHIWKRHLRDLRYVQYQTVLRSYADEIKPGMSRSDVEDALRQKNVSFLPVKFMDPGLDDLITIGHEDPTGFCTTNDVDVKIHFNSASEGTDAKSLPTDQVESVKLFEWPRGCL
jgi:hypothetical protein